MKKSKKKKNELSGEIDILIADVNKQDFEKLIESQNNKYFFTNYKKDLPNKFNIIIEACVNLSTQMNEKKNQIKKYNILAHLIEELYLKNEDYLNIYLSPFKKKNQTIITCPYFVFIITTNSAYDFFMTSAKKFMEDKKINYDYNLYIFYVKFKLNEISDLQKNNEDLEQKVKDLQKKNEDLEQRVKDLQSTVKTLQEQINELRNIINNK